MTIQPVTDDTRRLMQDALAKVPAVTLGFWVIKILATTLGETGADLFTQQYAMGYAAGIALFCVPLVILVAAQIMAKRFHKLLYWATILASTTAGTAMADFFDRSLGIGYTGGSATLLVCVLGSLLAWRLTLGTVSVASVANPRAEIFYWITITFSQTLGTALGDWTADSFGDATFLGLESGYVFGALIFIAALLIVAALYYFTGISRTVLFWAAFILTRPLGATVGDFLDKPLKAGGLGFGRDQATLVLIVVIALALWLIPQKPGKAH